MHGKNQHKTILSTRWRSKPAATNQFGK